MSDTDRQPDAALSEAVTFDDVDAYVHSLFAKQTPWASGCATVLQKLWVEVSALRSSPSAPSRDAVLEEAAKIRTVPRIGPLAGAAWLAYKEGQADYAAAILQHKNAAPQVPPKATRGRGERPVQFSRKR